jgi:hypothetical protein
MSRVGRWSGRLTSATVLSRYAVCGLDRLMAYHGVGLAAARANGAEREAIPESCQTRQRLRIPLMRKKTAITCLPTLYRLRRLRCSRW